MRIVKIISNAIISSPKCGAYKLCGSDSCSRFNRINTRAIIWSEMQLGTVHSNANINDYNKLLALKDVREGIETIRNVIKKYLI